MRKIEDKDIDLHIDRETLLQEYIPKAQYEQRLKVDMVAMLEDFDLEIHEWGSKESACYIPNYEAFKRFSNFIQEKIKSLKED